MHRVVPVTNRPFSEHKKLMHSATSWGKTVSLPLAKSYAAVVASLKLRKGSIGPGARIFTVILFFTHFTYECGNKEIDGGVFPCSSPEAISRRSNRWVLPHSIRHQAR
jgi:hypothetical protein